MLKWPVNKAGLAYLKAMSPYCYGLGHLVILIRERKVLCVSMLHYIHWRMLLFTTYNKFI